MSENSNVHTGGFIEEFANETPLNVRLLSRVTNAFNNIIKINNNLEELIGGGTVSGNVSRFGFFAPTMLLGQKGDLYFRSFPVAVGDSPEYAVYIKDTSAWVVIASSREGINVGDREAG